MAIKQPAARSGQPLLKFKGRHWTVGAVVAFSIVLAALLMILLQVIVFGRETTLKWDLTSSGINSLNRGTSTVLNSLDGETIYLTSLYLETDIETDAQKRYREAVSDLLRLYQSESPNVEIAWINPLKQQVELGELLTRVRGREKFKTETKPYVEAIDRFEEQVYKPFAAVLQGYVQQLDELEQAAAMTGGPASSGGLGRALATWIQMGDEVRKDLAELRQQPLVPYSEATQSILNYYDLVGSKIDLVITKWADAQMQGEEMSEGVKAVVAEMKAQLQPWIERFKAEQDKLQNLPPLELDELERALKRNNVVVVESKDGAKALSFEDIWPPLHEGEFAPENEFEQRRFAGEGAITPAILQLVQKEKTAVVFVRNGGPKLFGSSGFGFNAPMGPMTALKAELEKLNFMVAEWDVKQTKDRPAFDVKPAKTIYLVLRPGPTMGQQGMPMPPDLGPLERAAVLDAVNESGRALFLTGWEMFSGKYEYAEYLNQKWGIDVGGRRLVITATPISPGKWGLSQDFSNVNDVQFDEHELTAGLQSLAQQCVFPLTTTVKVVDEIPEGVAVAELAKAPASEDLWAVDDPQGFVKRYRDQRYTMRTAEDTPGPFPLALAASKDDKRMVVLAAGAEFISDRLAVNNVLYIAGNGQLQVRRQAPGNFALFTNILHYLDDTLQWLNVGSPIDTSRIEISDRQLRMWRVLAVGVFPALALLAGGCTWYMRRR